ncbi:MAG: hypothetical protein HN420_15210 [Rhodospirillaceae bacterium]|nr:hypothetical protein [Rhodospirillaceae bacterium]
MPAASADNGDDMKRAAIPVAAAAPRPEASASRASRAEARTSALRASISPVESLIGFAFQ